MALLMLNELGLSDFFRAVYGAVPHRFKKADVISTCFPSKTSVKKMRLL